MRSELFIVLNDPRLGLLVAMPLSCKRYVRLGFIYRDAYLKQDLSFEHASGHFCYELFTVDYISITSCY